MPTSPQLLAALALVVGPTRTVDSAIAELGTDAVAAAIPRLQLNALSGSTRTAIKHRAGLLGELQHTVIDRCAIEAPHYEQLARLSGKRLFGAVMLVAVTYFLLPQLADLPGIFTQIRDLDWVWLPPVVVLSAFTYVGATLGILGSIPERLRPVPTFVTQVASSFASTLAPSGLGGMALNVRYLQRSGVDPAVATSGVGLNTVAGVVMHLALLAVFVVWGGRQAFGSFSLPDWHVFVYGLAAVAVLAAGAFAVSSIRHMVFQRLLPMIRRSLDGLREVVRQPVKLLLVFGGSIIVTMSYITCLYLASHAFGGTLGFATVAAVYLAGSAVAGGADPGRARRARGRHHRRPGRRRHGRRRGRADRVPLPAGDVLVADHPRRHRLQVAAAPGVHLARGRQPARSGRRSRTARTISGSGARTTSSSFPVYGMRWRMWRRMFSRPAFLLLLLTNYDGDVLASVSMNISTIARVYSSHRRPRPRPSG